MSTADFYNNLFLNTKIYNSKEEDKSAETKLGKNVKTLVFCAPIQDENEQSLLENIMKSCKLPEGFQIASLVQSWRNYRDYNFREVLLFGVSETDLELSIELPKNWPMKFDNTIWIKTDSLADLIKHKNLKNELWLNALKPYFFPS